jgi:biopolymer transport protein ExbB/TolQ
MNVNDLAQRLGDACYVFLAMSFFWGLYCVIAVMRRLKQLRFRKEADQHGFLENVTQCVRQRSCDTALTLCEEDTRALPQLARAAIENRHLNYEQMRQFLGELLQRDVIADLEYRVSWIATVIKSGPLLGLFGTVLGMMAAFGRIGQGEKVEPAQIADEIAVALICTAMGLATAIPFGYFLSGINVRLRSLQDSLGAALLRLLENFM